MCLRIIWSLAYRLLGRVVCHDEALAPERECNVPHVPLNIQAKITHPMVGTAVVADGYDEIQVGSRLVHERSDCAL